MRRFCAHVYTLGASFMAEILCHKQQKRITMLHYTYQNMTKKAAIRVLICTARYRGS
jgi:hypothetical protein